MKAMHMKYLQFYNAYQIDIGIELYKITRWFKDTDDIQRLLYRVVNVLLLEKELSMANDIYVIKNTEDIEVVFFHKLQNGQNEEFRMRMYILQDKLMYEWMLTGNCDSASLTDYNEFTFPIEQAKQTQRRI